jgi:hypothetical protein
MRTLTILPLAFALTQAAALAAPQELQQTPAMSEIQVQGASVYKAQPSERDEVKGVYNLDNGATFKITGQQNRLYAELGQRGVTELVAVSADRFVAPAQNMTVQYVPQAFGDQVVLTYPAELNASASPMVTVTLAAK